MDPYNEMGRYGANKVVGREPCPRCRAGGSDRAGDNLIVYLDGHKHCYACGRHEHSEITLDTLKHLVEREHSKESDESKDELNFPKDYMPINSTLYGKEGFHWIRSYTITPEECTKFNIGWSQERLMLIFPVYDKDGKLLMWQGRNFNYGPKYLTFGMKSDILYLVGKEKCGTLVVTEDLVSAIKVGRTYQTAPLWGSEMSLELIQKAASHFDDLVIWLDRDKTHQAVKIALRASQYIPASVVDTALDPKDYSTDIMPEFITRAQMTKIYKEGILEGKTEAEEEGKHDPRRLWVEESYPSCHPKLLGPDGEPISMTDTQRGHEYDYRKGMHGS